MLSNNKVNFQSNQVNLNHSMTHVYTVQIPSPAQLTAKKKPLKKLSKKWWYKRVFVHHRWIIPTIFILGILLIFAYITWRFFGQEDGKVVDWPESG